MSVGPKSAAAAWLAIVATGSALLAFGLSNDSNTTLRDAVIELTLIREGPTRTFVEVCREFERRREQGFLVSPDQETKETWAAELIGSTPTSPLVSSDFKVSGLLWCPFPSRSMTVREALDLVTNPDNASVTLWPRSTFLSSLGTAIQEHRQAPDSVASEEKRQEFSRFYSLAADIASGKLPNRLDVTSDPTAGTHILFDCANTEAVFAPTDNKKLPKFPVQLVISLNNGSIYCLQEKDVPPEVVRLYGTVGFKNKGLYTSYFGGRIEKSIGYSNKAAAKTGLREVPQEKQVPNERGEIILNEWFGFDFPALRIQLKEVGSLTVDEAYDILFSKTASASDVAEIFGIKLPIRPYLLTTIIALPLLTAIFLGGYRLHGVGALPETLQGLPKPLIMLVVVGVVCLLPAVGLFLISDRLQFVLPDISYFLPITAICWVAGSVIALALTHRRRIPGS